MNNNKTPGQDGIPEDFYKVFWTKIKELFMEMLHESYNTKKLHQTARQGILNLIPKQNKDTRQIKNLRPITLLNTDYKIIEKAIANKMMPALKEIINKDQRGFMKDRRISVNIRKMLDIMQHAEKEDLEAVVLSLDFVKCFDKCSFSILHGSLDFFGFGAIVKEWTKILYKDFTVKIQNNGHFSQSIPIKKGVHQGGCCSSVYFLVIAEILALALRGNENIQGITIKDIKNLLNQFADDMDIATLCTEQSIKEIYRELEDFRKQSGFTVSYEKTTLYRIGSLRHSDAQMYSLDQFKWSNEDITVLGVTIAHEDLVSKNYIEISGRVKNILQAWHNRGLSLIGKIQVVNTLIASLFVYKMMVLPMTPKNIIKNVENNIRDFIWNGKKSKIAYGILQNPKKEGGLNLVDLRRKEISLKATWPQILRQEKEYAHIVYSFMRVHVLGENIWRCNIQPEDIGHVHINNTFWEQVLECWSVFNSTKEIRIENQIIWYNSKIRVGGRPFLWSDICKKRLLYIHQLFENKDFKTEQQVLQEFNLNTIRYNSIKMAIPKEWKTFFTTVSRQVYSPIPPHTYDMCMNVKGTGLSREIYHALAGNISLVHSKYAKWTMELGENFCANIQEFAEMHRDIYRITNVPKYRSFQYRIIQRGIITNIQLEKWNILSNKNCTFCNLEPETVTHLFCQCQAARRMWDKLIEYIAKTYNTRIQYPSDRDIIFNTIVKKPKYHIVNMMCLITKQYIYKQRCFKENLNFEHLVKIIWNIENMEKYIAEKNGKLQVHQKKWKKSIS